MDLFRSYTAGDVVWSLLDISYRNWRRLWNNRECSIEIPRLNRRSPLTFLANPPREHSGDVMEPSLLISLCSLGSKALLRAMFWLFLDMCQSNEFHSTPYDEVLRNSRTHRGKNLLDASTDFPFRAKTQPHRPHLTRCKRRHISMTWDHSYWWRQLALLGYLWIWWSTRRDRRNSAINRSYCCLGRLSPPPVRRQI